jgi:hypothetical protein
MLGAKLSKNSLTRILSKLGLMCTAEGKHQRGGAAEAYPGETAQLSGAFAHSVHRRSLELK